MRRLLVALLLALSLAALDVGHAQAQYFQTAADLGNNGGTTSTLSHSFTVPSGTNQLLTVTLQGDLISNGHDDITSVKFNGVAMTLAAKNTTAVSYPGNDRNLYQYYLVAPSQGTFPIAITAASNHYLLATAAVYQNIAQAAPEATATNTSATSPMTTALTTTHSDLVVVSGGGDGYGVACYTSANLSARICGAQFLEPSILDAPFFAGSISPNVSAPTGNADLMTAAVAYQISDPNESNSKLLTVPIVGPSLTAASNSKLLTVPIVGPSLTAASNSKLLTVVVVNTNPAHSAPMRMPLTHW